MAGYLFSPNAMNSQQLSLFNDFNYNDTKQTPNAQMHSLNILHFLDTKYKSTSAMSGTI